jgi:hypothetical protein
MKRVSLPSYNRINVFQQTSDVGDILFRKNLNLDFFKTLCVNILIFITKLL